MFIIRDKFDDEKKNDCESMKVIKSRKMQCAFMIFIL